MNRNELHGMFLEMHLDLEKVKFDPAWSNGTGYLDKAVHAGFNHPVASTDNHGRKIILTPDCHGTMLVVFERYTNGDVLVCNASRKLKEQADEDGLNFNGALGEQEVFYTEALIDSFKSIPA